MRGALLALAVAGLGCKASQTAPAAPPEATPALEAAALPANDRLPEDPEAGKRSELQWREHLREEEKERQLMFDGQRLAQHRALIQLLIKAQQRLDGARNEPGLARQREAVAKASVDFRRRITEIDHWGVNSRLLADYEALIELLAGPYAEAKSQALAGEPERLMALRQDITKRLTGMRDWLAEAEEAREEGDGESDEGHR